MTREEELDWLYRLRSEIYVYMPKEWLIPMNNALDMAVKDLEQQPCGDAISRQAVLDLIVANHTELNGLNVVMYSPFYKDIIQLPSVKPQGTGHWKAKSFHELYCDNCGFDFDIMRNDFIDKMKYCPNCGARMVGEKESEE